MTATEHPRSIRSFVTRGGRITAAQERALSLLWPKYGVAFGTQRLETQALFGRDAPCTIEIGFGNGENLLSLAAAHPGRNFLGVEVHRPGVGRLLLGIEERGLANVRVICHDALEVLSTLMATPELENLAADGAFVPRSAERAPTRFERRGERLGHEVWDLAFRRT